MRLISGESGPSTGMRVLQAVDEILYWVRKRRLQGVDLDLLPARAGLALHPDVGS